MKKEESNIPFWPVMTAIFFGSFLAILGISTISVNGGHSEGAVRARFIGK